LPAALCFPPSILLPEITMKKRLCGILSFLLKSLVLATCGGGGSGGDASQENGGPPITTVSAAASVTQNGATLNGNVTPNGLATQAWFEYSTDASLSTYTSTMMLSIGDGLSAIPVERAVRGCAGGTAYYSRICGKNTKGTTKSTITSFTTFWIPPEVPVRQAYYSLPTPPEGFLAAVGTMQAIHDTRFASSSKVDVDWMRLHVILDNGSDVVLKTDEFDAYSSAMSYYGLYKRIPWYEGDRLDDMPFNVAEGSLVMEPSLHSDRVFHWWNTSRAWIPGNVRRVWFEARVRVTGPALVQASMDYWKNNTIDYGGPNVNNREAGASDWIFEATDWQMVRVGGP
jgi:hypothetical protein